MALNTKQLAVLSYANLFTLWYYKTKTGEVIDYDYFNNCAKIFNEGDKIIINIYDDVVHSKGLTETMTLIVKKIENGKVILTK